MGTKDTHILDLCDIYYLTFKYSIKLNLQI